MREEVRIKLRSVRYEVEASMFSDESDETVAVSASEEDNEPEKIEINTLGIMKKENGRIEISYEETQATGMEGSSTAVSF